MKKILGTSLLLIATIPIVGASNPQPGAQDRARNRAPNRAHETALPVVFNVGEQLVYNVSWSDVFDAGELTISTRERTEVDGRPAFHIVAHAQSVGLVNALFYKVNDTYDSYVDAETLQPLRAEKHTRRGKRRQDTTMVLDAEYRTATLTTGETIKVPSETYDLASLFFAMRSVDLTPHRIRTVYLLENDKLYTVKLDPEAAEKITTNGKHYDTFRVAVRITPGIDTSDKDLYRLRLYLSNDSRRTPVLLKAQPSWGEIMAELTSLTPGVSPTEHRLTE